MIGRDENKCPSNLYIDATTSSAPSDERQQVTPDCKSEENVKIGGEQEKEEVFGAPVANASPANEIHENEEEMTSSNDAMIELLDSIVFDDDDEDDDDACCGFSSSMIINSSQTTLTTPSDELLLRSCTSFAASVSSNLPDSSSAIDACGGDSIGVDEAVDMKEDDAKFSPIAAHLPPSLHRSVSGFYTTTGNSFVTANGQQQQIGGEYPIAPLNTLSWAERQQLERSRQKLRQFLTTHSTPSALRRELRQLHGFACAAGGLLGTVEGARERVWPIIARTMPRAERYQPNKRRRRRQSKTQNDFAMNDGDEEDAVNFAEKDIDDFVDVQLMRRSPSTNTNSCKQNESSSSNSLNDAAAGLAENDGGEREDDEEALSRDSDFESALSTISSRDWGEQRQHIDDDDDDDDVGGDGGDVAMETAGNAAGLEVANEAGANDAGRFFVDEDEGGKDGEGGTTNDFSSNDAPQQFTLKQRRNQSLSALRDHRDWRQVELDVHRTLARFPPNIGDAQRSQLQQELTPLIVSVLADDSAFNYYQGFHDVCLTFLLVLGTKSALDCLRHVVGRGPFHNYLTLRLEDSVMVELEDNFYPLLHLIAEDVERVLYATNLGTLFALSWPLTWFSHAIQDYHSIVPFFDLFLCSHHLMPMYVAATLVSARRDEIFRCEPEMPYLHKLLCEVPSPNKFASSSAFHHHSESSSSAAIAPLNLDRVLQRAQELFERYPPLALDAYRDRYRRLCDERRRQAEEEAAARTQSYNSWTGTWPRRRGAAAPNRAASNQQLEQHGRRGSFGLMRGENEGGSGLNRYNALFAVGAIGAALSAAAVYAFVNRLGAVWTGG